MHETRAKILDYDMNELTTRLIELGEKKFRAKQLWQWLHQKIVSTPQQMTNLSKTFMAMLNEEFVFSSLKEQKHLVSKDELTEKWLFSPDLNSGVIPDTPTYIESVLIREIKGRRRTVCVSCMSGCPIGCAFCATGQCGFERNLTSGEILEQIYTVERRCTENDQPGLTNIVFMGMGEPLLNYDHVIKAARTVCSEDGLNMSGRHVTISTVGIPSGIRRLAAENVNFRLALSLHAPEQKLRESLIPVAAKWKLPDIISALKEFSQTSSRHITIEYCLINKINDSKKQARELVELLKPIPCKVNLIPLNPTEEFNHTPPPKDRIRAFQSTLESHGLSATLREEKGQDINAACGQLRQKSLQQQKDV